MVLFTSLPFLCAAMVHWGSLIWSVTIVSLKISCFLLHWISLVDKFGNYCMKLSLAKTWQIFELKSFCFKTHMPDNLSLYNSSTTVHSWHAPCLWEEIQAGSRRFQCNSKAMWEPQVTVRGSAVFERGWSDKDGNHTTWRPSVPEDCILSSSFRCSETGLSA